MMTVMMMMLIMLMMKMKIMLIIKDDDDDEADCGQKQREQACKGTQVQPARQVAATGLCVHQWTAPVARTAMKTLYNDLNYLFVTSPTLAVYSTVRTTLNRHQCVRCAMHIIGSTAKHCI